MAKVKGLLLLSGGIDSPVAAFLVKKRGYSLEAVHFSHHIFTSKEPEHKSAALAKKLRIPLTIIDVNEAFSRIAKEARHNLYFVLQKRLMLRIAEKIAKKRTASFLVTGENLGQVSSQTLWNLGVIDRAVTLPVLRPLLTMEKNEIVKIAQEIGTFEISKGPEHCDALGPEHPRTRARLDEVLEEEERIGIAKLVEKTAA